MAFPIAITIGVTAGGHTAQSTITYSTTGAPFVDEDAIPIGTNTEVDVQIPTGAKCLIMFASVDATLKTNSTSAPDNTWNVKAGEPFIWWNTMVPYSNPISAAITKIYVTCAAILHLQIFPGVDATP